MCAFFKPECKDCIVGTVSQRSPNIVCGIQHFRLRSKLSNSFSEFNSDVTSSGVFPRLLLLCASARSILVLSLSSYFDFLLLLLHYSSLDWKLCILAGIRTCSSMSCLCCQLCFANSRHTSFRVWR